MKIVTLRSLLIGIVVGVVITAVSTLLTGTFHQSSGALGAGRVLTGLDAVKAAIDAFGVAGYIKGLAGAFLLFFAAIFIGALWQGSWTLRSPR